MESRRDESPSGSVAALLVDATRGVFRAIQSCPPEFAMAIVYVVDDFSNVLASVLRELKVVPANIIGFTSAIEALAAIEDRPPDVLVTDLLMPEMNGVELAWQIRRQNSRLATIIMSTTESEVVETLADLPGLVATLRKPWPPGSIAILVRSALRSI